MPKPGDIKYCDPLGGHETNATFVYIPPGSFWMGNKSEDDNPTHFVAISKGFWIQQTPLTTAQYNYLTIGSAENQYQRSTHRPQTQISWSDISDGFKGTDLRMPTDAEWEYAARGAVGYKYKFAGSNIVNNVAWTKNKQPEPNFHVPRPVAQLKNNTFNLYDMSGNVREWCLDWDKELTHQPAVDPKLEKRGPSRVARNGSFVSDPLAVRIEFFTTTEHTYVHSALGVRLVWEI